MGSIMTGKIRFQSQLSSKELGSVNGNLAVEPQAKYPKEVCI